MDISIVVPTYNEKRNVTILSRKLKEILDRITKKYEIIFVEDGSRDGTYQELRDLQKEDKKIKIIKFRRNYGQTQAFSAGFDYAKGNIVITIDADLQNNPADIPRLIEKIGQGYDVVSGWRFKRKDTLSKHLISRLGNKVRNYLVEDGIHDSGCSLKAFRKEAVKGLKLYGETHRFIPAILKSRGFRVTEIKVHHHPRRFGKTKYGMKRVVNGFLDVLIVKFWKEYSTKPVYLFGKLGLASMVLGFLAALYNIIKYQSILQVGPSLLFAVFSIIIGIQFFTFGILADILLKTYYKDQKTYEIKEILDK